MAGSNTATSFTANSSFRAPEKCSCGLDAGEKTVRKEGNNYGRQFFACSKPQDNSTRCNFFMVFLAYLKSKWKDEIRRDEPLRHISMNRSNISVVNCHCAEPSATRNVKKEGANFGRQFLACAKAASDSTKCDFFQWCDESSDPTSSTQNRRPDLIQTRPIANENSQNISVTCICGISAALRNVKKEGSNFGKQFFACSKPQSDPTKCDFFQWNDSSTDSAYISRFEQNAQISATSKTKCHCNLIALTKTCSKAGQNQGRQFYTCTKSSARCNFFQWIDEEGSGSFQRAEGFTFQGRGSSSNSTGGISGGITCFKCGQEGHFATNCNSRNDKRRSSGNSSKGKRRKNQL